MQTVLITGGTGLIGSALCRYLRGAGYRIIILTRRKPAPTADPGLTYTSWNPGLDRMDAGMLRGVDYIIHLAGASIMKGRWSEKRKNEILESRVAGTRLLSEKLRNTPHHVKAFISASATGYYGDRPHELCTEETGKGNGFLSEVCDLWEAEAWKIARPGIRVVMLRTGIVLNRTEGLLPALARPLTAGVTAIAGNGSQWISWIHLQDIVRIYGAALEDESMRGVFNAVSPFPVTQGRLATDLARTIRRNFAVRLHAPPAMIGFLMGQRGLESLKSCKASAEKLLDTGFEFSYPAVSGALEALYGLERDR
jgi:uncharacterized protein (TIGR01777 family)